MKYLGLDLGSKTVGISFSESGIIASNLETYRFLENDYQVALEYLQKVVERLKIDIVVIGFPKHMNNDIGLRGQISTDFKVKLESICNIKVVLWDERLSTKSALAIFNNSKKKEQKRKKLKDEIAAVIILQNYLDYIGGTK